VPIANNAHTCDIKNDDKQENKKRKRKTREEGSAAKLARKKEQSSQSANTASAWAVQGDKDQTKVNTAADKVTLKAIADAKSVEATSIDESDGEGTAAEPRKKRTQLETNKPTRGKRPTNWIRKGNHNCRPKWWPQWSVRTTLLQKSRSRRAHRKKARNQKNQVRWHCIAPSSRGTLTSPTIWVADI